MKNKNWVKFGVILVVVVLAVFYVYIRITSSMVHVIEKPIIYLYPENTMDITIVLDVDGELTTTYPEYDAQWNVRCNPDGSLINKADGKEYYGLFWESETSIDWQFDVGFVVPGTETGEFLDEKMKKLGLSSRERNEMIVYWLPDMEDNAYNLIHFASEQYTESAHLSINPEPDSLIRVFMVWKGLEQVVDIKEQELKTPVRDGFTVVEWGGTELRK